MDNADLTCSPQQKQLWIIKWVFLFMVGSLLVMGCADQLKTETLYWITGIWVIVMFLILRWIFAYYNSLKYKIEADALHIWKGVLWQKYITIPTSKITNIDIIQGPLQKKMGIGNICIHTESSVGFATSQGKVSINGISDLLEVRNTIMERASYEQIKTEVAVEKDSETLSKLLNEVSAIKKLLEKRK